MHFPSRTHRSHPTRGAAWLLVMVLASSCSSTRLVESWAAPGVEAKDFSFQHVVAIAAIEDPTRQRLAEDALASAETETRVTPAYTLLSREDMADPERLRAVLEKHGIDGAITVRLVGVEDKETYVPPSTYAGAGYYGYWGRYGAPVYDPGYVRTDTFVKIETSLYSVQERALLWSGVSETMNPDTVAEVIEGVVTAASKDLRKRGLLD